MSSWDCPSMIVFDADDTLWVTEPLYDQARNLASAVVASAGISVELWDAVQRRLDIENVRTMGVSSDRFPRSCVEAYQHLSAASSFDPVVAEQIDAAARSVFLTKAPLVDGVEDALRFANTVSELRLLTKGDPKVQARRLGESGLKSYFSTVTVVASKTPSDFAAEVHRSGRRTDRCWSVGNSFGSDIEPALVVGMRGVWIDAYVWPVEQSRPDIAPGNNVAILNSLTDFRTLLADVCGCL